MPAIGAIGAAIFGAGTVGATMVTGAIIGAIIGAAGAVITGGNILQGALFGAIAGGVTAGVLSPASAAASTASSTAVPSAAAGAGEAAAVPASVSAAAAETAGPVAGAVTAPSYVGATATPFFGVKPPSPSVPAPAPAPSGGGGLLSNMSPSTAKIVAGIGKGAMQGLGKVGSTMLENKSARELAEFQAQVDRERFTSTPSLFSRKTVNVTPPASWSSAQWWQDHLYPNKKNPGLLT